MIQNNKKDYILMLLRKLQTDRTLKKTEFVELLKNRELIEDELFQVSKEIHVKNFHRKVYVRGLIETIATTAVSEDQISMRRGIGSVQTKYLNRLDLVQV